MSREIAVNRIEATGNESEHLTVTVDGHEVWRAYADQLRENDWPLLVRGVGTAVANVIHYLDEQSARQARAQASEGE